jgi:hypothetical protein
VSRPLRLALHSLSLSRGKNFHVPPGEVFPLVAQGLLRNITLFPRALRRHFLAPRRREKHVLFFPRKVLSCFAAPFFIAFRAKNFRPHGSADCMSFRRVRPIWCGWAGARGVVAVLK